MSQRIECSKRQCRWTGTFSTAHRRDDGFMKTAICPRCNCDSFYDLPNPVKSERAEQANALIKAISSHGRKFFDYKGEVSTIEVDAKGKVWFVDSYTKRRIYTHYQGRWSGFSNGGTLRDLVCCMRNYITKGHKIPLAWIAPTRFNPENGDIWGYGQEAAADLRKEVALLDIIDESKA
ncbi:hypothetical protein [Shewanella sp. MBTL60-007]|uniref:hypothetical protein n=1 Tax=Shewanella sp. MBTL60-007 TaxID=2815911 RepID=UPI001BC0FD3A|nr:hypothetical protein [Shewanella sp. MBTL60-007]GIU22103.1 hypothetical protein TUM3792_23770 [Shewanella sp. MBTL60-007]